MVIIIGLYGATILSHWTIFNATNPGSIQDFMARIYTVTANIGHGTI